MEQTPEPGALTIASTYHDAWKDRAYEKAWRLLDENLAVDVPINAYPTKSSFVEAAHRTREMATAVTDLAEFGTEQEAVLIYDMALPMGNLRIAECFRIEGGLISKIVHIHDTATLRDAAAVLQSDSMMTDDDDA